MPPETHAAMIRISKNNSRPPILIAIAIAIIALDTLVLVLRPTAMPAWTAGLAILIVTLGLAPMAHFFARPSEDRPTFPLLVLTGAFYAVFYGFSAFTAEVLRDPETKGIAFYSSVRIENIGVATQVLIAAGLVAMFAGYAVARQPSLRLGRFRLPSGLDSRRVNLVFWALLAGHLIYVAVPALRGIASIGQFLQPAGFLAFAGFYILWRRRKLGYGNALFVLFALIVDLAFMLRSTSTLPIILMATMFTALEWSLKRRLPWVWLLCFIVAAPPLYMLVQVVRTPLWATGANIGLTDVPFAIFKSAQYWIAGRDQARSEGTNDQQLKRMLGTTDAQNLITRQMRIAHIGLARRVGHVSLMEHVVANTPDRIPYWQGETYRPLLTSWIPRFLWPGKPREETGWAFGRRYGILKTDDPPQSINLPWMIEMYANFGGPGVILGMGLVGALFAFLEGFLSRPSMTPAETAVGTAVMLPLFMQDSNFSLMTGSLVLLIVAFWIVLAAASKIPLPPTQPTDRPRS